MAVCEFWKRVELLDGMGSSCGALRLGAVLSDCLPKDVLVAGRPVVPLWGNRIAENTAEPERNQIRTTPE